MKASFFSGVILGFAAVVAAAGYYPWVEHVRLPSRTSVLTNGGRAERFLIRLPADRIAALAEGQSSARLQSFPASLRSPDDVGEGLLLLEHFKIRDAVGDVIGLASRHTVGVGESAETAWSVFIPSRGALLLAGDAVATTLDRRLAEEGFRPGQPWTGDVWLPPPSPDRTAGGQLLAGTEEFEGLAGEYEESWHVTGVSAAGELRGTVELNTVLSSR